MNQTNDGLRVQLRKVKVMLKEAEDSKASELDLLAKDNVNLRNQLREMKNYGKEQESDDAEEEEAVNLLVKENTNLKNELQKVRTILQEAEVAKSELGVNFAESNTGLETDPQKARSMWKEEEESKATEFDYLTKKNLDLTNQLRRFEVECKQQEFEDAKRDKAESKDEEDKDEASKAFLKEISELRKENDKLKEGIQWEKIYQNSYIAQASAEAEYANRIQTLEAALGNLKEKDKEDVPKRTKEGKPDQDDRELQGTADATPEAHGSHTPDVLALTPDATLL